jgi:hypothetical protein
MEKMSTLRSTQHKPGFTSRPERRVVLYGKESSDSNKNQVTQARDSKRTFRRGTMIYQH